MTDHIEGRTTRADRAAVASDYAEDEISLRPYFDTLWGYRRVIGAAIVGTMFLFAVGALAGYLRVPAERLASIQFRLLFDGAAQNQYPSASSR